MKDNAKTIEEYIEKLPTDQKDSFLKLLETIRQNIPSGFEEQINYGMIGFVVPHKKYPQGYHVNPKDPLPFINLAMQKNHISLYHMGMYTKKDLLDWFLSEYPKHSKYKPDMGTSCVRFKKPKDIPMDLVGELLHKMTLDEWIDLYEQNLKR